MTPKERAGEAALTFIENGMIVGLGTGSTAKCFIDSLGQALKDQRLKDIRGIPTSIRSQQQARQLGIPLTDFAHSPLVDVTIDGADEIGPKLSLIKGLGGALLREKLVAQNSKRLIVIADDSKLVKALGTKTALPVEVATFSHEASARFLAAQGCEPVLRVINSGEPYHTDNGNYIYDCRFPGIPDPAALENVLAYRAGIVETGLFIGIADLAVLATDKEVLTLRRDQ